MFLLERNQKKYLLCIYNLNNQDKTNKYKFFDNVDDKHEDQYINKYYSLMDIFNGKIIFKNINDVINLFHNCVSSDNYGLIIENIKR